MDLQQYLNGGIKNITAKAGRFYLGNKNGRRFLAHFVPAAERASLSDIC